jgi:hypothetical protein
MEALVPSLAGGAVALALTLLALHALNTARLGEFATVDGFLIDWRIFGFAMLVSSAAGSSSEPCLSGRFSERE